MRRFRCKPPRVAYLDGDGSNVRVGGVETSSLSDLDRFVRAWCEDVVSYRRAVCKVALAERFAWGSTALLELMDLASRAVFIGLAAGTKSVGVLHLVNLWSLVKGL